MNLRLAYAANFKLSPPPPQLVVNGFTRGDVLLRNVPKYLECPTLSKVVVIWSNQKVAPNEGLVQLAAASQGRFEIQRMPTPSLNNRYAYLPPSLASLIHADDDMFTPCEGLQELVETHRHYPSQITGIYLRSHVYHAQTGEPQYNTVPQRDLNYSIVLTKMMLLSSDYHYAYQCLLPPGVAEEVDRQRNCEDISMNFVSSALSGLPPVYHHLTGPRRPQDVGLADGRGISHVHPSAHARKRSMCMAEFERVFQRMPLVYTTTAAIATKHILERSQ